MKFKKTYKKIIDMPAEELLAKIRTKEEVQKLVITTGRAFKKRRGEKLFLHDDQIYFFMAYSLLFTIHIQITDDGYILFTEGVRRGCEKISITQNDLGQTVLTYDVELNSFVRSSAADKYFKTYANILEQSNEFLNYDELLLTRSKLDALEKKLQKQYEIINVIVLIIILLPLIKLSTKLEFLFISIFLLLRYFYLYYFKRKPKATIQFQRIRNKLEL